MDTTVHSSVAPRPPALRDVPPFPPVAARLMRLVAEEQFSYKKVADLIRSDAAFSVEVLRLANSAVFGFRKEIRDILHALAVLGLDRLRGIVVTLAMRDILFSQRQHEALRVCWRHNLACALSAETLASAFWIEAGYAYTAGLLHSVGMLAMVGSHEQEYAELINGHCHNPEDFLLRERELMGIDHCEAGRILLEDWNLPSEFAAIASRHHQPPAAGAQDIHAAVYLACQCANMAGFAICASPSDWDATAIIDMLPEKTRSRFRVKLDDFPITLATRINSFDCDFL